MSSLDPAATVDDVKDACPAFQGGCAYADFATDEMKKLSAELSLVKKGFDKQKASPPLIHRDHPLPGGLQGDARRLFSALRNSVHTRFSELQ